MQDNTRQDKASTHVTIQDKTTCEKTRQAKPRKENTTPNPSNAIQEHTNEYKIRQDKMGQFKAT